MTLPTNGHHRRCDPRFMPPYHLDTDLPAAMFAAAPPPQPGAPMAWRQQRATRLVRKVAGTMPADAPRARIAAGIVIVREATEHSLASANAPGLSVAQASRLRRTAAALLASAARWSAACCATSRSRCRFFGSVRVGRVDSAAIAPGWGGKGAPRAGGAVPCSVVPVGRPAATTVANSRTCASTS